MNIEDKYYKELQSQIQETTVFVTNAHKNQTRNNNGYIALPYIVHPMEVMKMVWDHNFQFSDWIMAAIAHDTLEDTNISEKELQDQIGEKAFNIVKELTFIPISQDRQEIKKEKAQYIMSFHHKSIPSLIIKVCDRICNTEDFARNDRRYAWEYLCKAEELFRVLTWKERDIQENPSILNMTNPQVSKDFAKFSNFANDYYFNFNK